MEEQIKQLEYELADLKKELAVCQKEIAKRNDKSNDYVMQLAEIKEDISIVEEELAILKNSQQTFNEDEKLGDTPEQLPEQLGNIKLEKE